MNVKASIWFIYGIFTYPFGHAPRRALNDKMSIWDRLFGNNPSPATADQPNYRFGRYSDAYKDKSAYDFWDRSLNALEDGDFRRSFTSFLQYLRDPEEDNVKWKEEDDDIYFEFYQGSKRITGKANNEGLRAEAMIARLGVGSAELLQRLTALNYELKYSRYGLNDSRCLCIIFDSKADDASPHKLYYAFKEMALQADKQDDLLIDEFKQLVQVEHHHLQQISLESRRTKEGFLRRSIQDLLDYLASGKLNPEEHPGALAYLLLDKVCKLDYLLLPEGTTMEALERMQRLYFASESGQPITHRNLRLIAELQELLQQAPDQFGKELYVGKYTFGITTPANHDRLRTLIDGELGNMDWYQENGYQEVALAVPGYIVGYSLFNFALPLPLRDFLHLYYRVREDAYFRRLGYPQEFLDGKNRPQRRAVRAAISEIEARHREAFPRLRPVSSGLIFDNLTDFSRSYLRMLYELDLGRR